MGSEITQQNGFSPLSEWSILHVPLKIVAFIGVVHQTMDLLEDGETLLE